MAGHNACNSKVVVMQHPQTNASTVYEWKHAETNTSTVHEWKHAESNTSVQAILLVIIIIRFLRFSFIHPDS